MLRLIVEKFQADKGEYWSNVYHIPGSSPVGATSIGQAIANAEKPLYGPHVIITKFRIDDKVIDTDNYQVVTMNAPGTRAGATSTSSMPLFNVARVDFNVAAGGRPCRKYLRCMQEQDTTGEVINASLITALTTYAGIVIAQGVTDPDGNAVSSASIWPSVGMRQLRKGAKKKVTP